MEAREIHGRGEGDLQQDGLGSATQKGAPTHGSRGISSLEPTSTPDASGAERASGVRAVLGIRDFRLLWLAQVISDFGDGLANLGVLLLINRLTGSTAALAIQAALLMLPKATIGLLVGVYVDRFDRRRLMLISDALRGISVLGLCLVRSAELVWLLYLVTVLQAVVGTLFSPARHALLPSLVPSKDLLAANSLSQTGYLIANLLGATAAGVLLSTWEVAWPAFVADALTFFASFALVAQIRPPPAVRRGRADSAAVSAVLRELREGMRAVANSRPLTGAMLAASVIMLGMGATNVLFVPLVVNHLKVPEAWLAALQLAQLTAMVASGSLFAALATRLEPPRIIVLGLLLLGPAVICLSRVSAVWHLIVALFIVGWITTPLHVAVSTTIQSASEEVRGRVSASFNTLSAISSLLSMTFAGAFGDVMGIRNVFVISGILAFVAGVAMWFVLWPARRLP